MKSSVACPYCSTIIALGEQPADLLRCPECQQVVPAGANGDTSNTGGSATLAPEMLNLLRAGRPEADVRSRTAPPGYEILEPLGRGGMGVVYRARDVQLDRIVALKMIRRGDDASAEDILRFRTEAEAVARLHHLNIVQIHTIGEHEGLPFVSLEYCAGGSLEKRLRGTPLVAAEAARLVAVLALAMHDAHGHGIVHRDLKPANILLAARPTPYLDDTVREGSSGTSNPPPLQELQPKIGDFGLAKKLDAPGQTQTGAVMGTPSYMAPEQASGTKGVGPAADIYALGAILYETLTGRPPFRAATSMDTILQVLNEEPVPPTRLNPKTPRDLETICLKCLQKNASKRYATAAELADDLDRFLTGEPIRARRTPLWERTWKWARRRPARAALLVTCCLAIVILLVAWRIVDRRFQHDQAAERVEALTTASAEGVPYVLDALRPLRSLAVPLLHERFAAAEGRSKVRLACGLAAFGEPPLAFLADAVVQVPASPGECRALLDSLATSNEESRRLLFERYRKGSDPSQKIRYAVVLLYLGDAQAARECLALGPDPILRTTFIHNFAGWHADLRAIADALDTNKDPALRSGLCSALATLDGSVLESAEHKRLQSVLAQLFQNAPDAGTHAAAGLVLRRWKLGEPKIAPNSKPRAGSNWFVNSKGMTMIRVAPGAFIMGDLKTDDATRYLRWPHKVTLTRPYCIADREVSVEQFQEFFKQDLPPYEKPHDWPGPDPMIGPTADCPVQRVSWYDAILYCNWLSRSEGRTPCYKFRTMAEVQKGAGKIPIWDCLWDADGYRLPTDAEWEFACRAGTTSTYFFGEDELMLHRYGTYSSGHKKATTPVASLLPNPWGLFDTHANLWEWCWDVFQNFTTEARVDPRGPDPLDIAAGRIVRGGGVANRGGNWRSSARGETNPVFRNYNQGFRIACKAE